MQLPASSGLSQVEWLTSRVDDLEAKLAYCGSKMDSLLCGFHSDTALKLCVFSC